MKIKVEGSGTSVILTVSYSILPGDDPWKASPIGIIGADKGKWRIESNGTNYNVLFYGTDSNDRILLFESVTSKGWGNPFHKGDSGYGFHESEGGVMLTNGTVEWTVLSA
jgi:hypothetical protein